LKKASQEGIGDALASVIYLAEIDQWEVQLRGDETLFDTFSDAMEFLELNALFGSEN
jgi:hypothetical protein